MKKRIITLIALAGAIAAFSDPIYTVVYSNGFSGTEFKVDGVSAASTNNVSTATKPGYLVTTLSTANASGFFVSIDGLGIAADPDMLGVRLTISGITPTAGAGNWLGFGMASGTANFNFNLFANPGVVVRENGSITVAGGIDGIDNGMGIATNQIFNSANGYTTASSPFTMTLECYKDGTISFWFDDIKILTNAPSGNATLNMERAMIAFRTLDPSTTTAAVDWFTIETIAVPEAATALFFAIGSIGVFVARRYIY